MATPSSFLWPFLAISFSLLFSSVFSDPSPSDINSWCSKTRYPKACIHYISHSPHTPTPKTKSDFRKLAIQIALDRALGAQNHNKWLGDKCRNKLEKAAWADCLELYETTVQQLNSTLNPPSGCTTDDTQTWLSSALTNLETCKAGFTDLGVTDYILPLMSNNVSKLICNTLAMNKEGSPSEPNYKDGFPDWLSAGGRKLLQAPTPTPNLVVAQDGSGNYRTIKEAVAAASKKSSGSSRFVIHVKAGVYKENVVVSMKNVMLTGDGIGKTVITGSKSVGGGSTTFDSATFAVTGDRFMALDMTFINTAGAKNHQAVAMRSGSDLSVFYRCSFQGYQDTLYVHSQRQFYRECDIYGTVDFIFGNAAVVFQNCNIYARVPAAQQKNTITAQGRTDPNQNTGISIHNSRVMASSDLNKAKGSVQTFLGRPWQQYSRTVYMNTFLDSLIAPAGWLEWSGNFALNTLYYGEYRNTGPGSSTANRVKWSGYRVIKNPTEASQFTVGNFIAGGSWIPSTGVPFTSGL